MKAKQIDFLEHRWTRALTMLFFLAMANALNPCHVTAQSQQPAPQKFTLEQIEGLVAHGVPDATLSNQIRLHGLAFAPTPAIVDELRAKGAGPLTLAAVSASKGASPSTAPGPSTLPAPPPKPRKPHPASLPGKVELQTEPGSTVFLDGDPVGNADAQGLLSLPAVPAGNHELIAKNDGYQDAHLQFAIASSEDKQVSLLLTWQGGYLAVSVQPVSATVSVSGPKTFTIGPAEVKCQPGTYTVTASLDGYLSQTRTIQIVAGEHHNETFALVVDPAVLVRKLDGAKSKLAAGDPAGAEQVADAVLAQAPDNPDAAAIVAESAFQQGDMNRFVDAGAKAILGGKQVTVRTMHAHTVLALWIHPMDVTISESGITAVSNPPDSRCKIPPSVGFDLIQSAQVVRDPQRGFIELHIQYASKPHGAILHDLDFVPDSSQVVTTRAPGQVFGSGTSSIQEPGNAGQTLNGILRLIIKAKR